MRIREVFLPLFLVVFVIVSAQSQRSAKITAGELQAHVKFLASDQLEGRRAGSSGADQAAEYIAAEFKAYGLQPLGPDSSYLQTFNFVAGVRLGPNNRIVLKIGGTWDTTAEINKEFRPLGFSASGTYSGEIVFAGYGISAQDKAYDDYAGLNVRDKAVLVLRNAPPIDSTRGALDQYSSLRYKATKARELGAKAIFFVMGPTDPEKDQLVRLSYDQSMGGGDILALSVAQPFADRLVSTSGMTLRQLQDSILRRRQPYSRLLPEVTVALQVEVATIPARSSNVIGFLQGTDAKLDTQVVVIGAHYDHLGLGGEGSGSHQPDTVAVHHGADDNASGTAGLLELAQWFAAQGSRLKRSMVFIAFTGEELGVLGSAYYVKHPAIPIEHTVAMLNMDMIGRLTNRTLIVYGTGTSPGFDSLLRAHDLDSAFVLKLVRDGFGPSDHSSFYGKQIPVLHFFTDLHPDYHRPSDEYQKLNYDALADVVRFVGDIASDLNRFSDRPPYAAVETPRAAGNTGRGFRVFVGTIPDFGEQTKGMRISGVRDGSPAEKAGLRAGDIIIKFGRVNVQNLYDYTYALGEYKPGDVVELTIKRGTEVVRTNVVLEARN